MSVRLSTMQIFQGGLNRLLDVQSQVNDTNERIATGKRVLTPGDDPIAATRILQLSQELESSQLYTDNMNTLQNRLEREDVALDQISDLLQKAQELIIQSGDGALNFDQRGFIAIEMESVVEQMAQAMNTRDANGEYIFAGLKSKETPFVLGADGKFRYKGDDGQRGTQIGPGNFVKSNDSGRQLFVDIESTTNTISATANPRNLATPPAIIGGEVILDQQVFDDFYPEDVVIEFRPVNEVEPPLLTYTVKQMSDGKILSKNVAYQPGQLIEFGGTGVRVSGGPVVGDTFIVTSTNKKSMLATLEEFSVQLRNLSDSSEDRGQLEKELANALANMNLAQTSLLEVRSSVGARLNVVESTRSNNEDVKLSTQANLSTLQDLDWASEVSKLSQETFILEAAQASFVRISKLSLFNFL